MLGEELCIVLCLKTDSDSQGKLFSLPGARTEKSIDACLPCIMRDCGSNQAVLEDQCAHTAERSAISDLS